MIRSRCMICRSRGMICRSWGMISWSRGMIGRSRGMICWCWGMIRNNFIIVSFTFISDICYITTIVISMVCNMLGTAIRKSY